MTTRGKTKWYYINYEYIYGYTRKRVRRKSSTTDGDEEMIEIKSRPDGSVLFKSEKKTIKEALEEANLEGADLEGVNLKGADLKVKYSILCTINFKKEEYEQAKQFIEGLK